MYLQQRYVSIIWFLDHLELVILKAPNKVAALPTCVQAFLPGFPSRAALTWSAQLSQVICTANSS